MTVKLNLTINELVARRIKSYAARRRVSVSKIVEEQLKEILDTEKKDDSFRKFLEKYAGSIKGNKPLDIDKERDRYIKEKHGL